MAWWWWGGSACTPTTLTLSTTTISLYHTSMSKKSHLNANMEGGPTLMTDSKHATDMAIQKRPAPPHAATNALAVCVCVVDCGSVCECMNTCMYVYCMNMCVSVCECGSRVHEADALTLICERGGTFGRQFGCAHGGIERKRRHSCVRSDRCSNPFQRSTMPQSQRLSVQGSKTVSAVHACGARETKPLLGGQK